MKRILSILTIILLLLINTPIYADTLSNEDIQAEAGILIDASTGEVLYEKNAEKKMYPASTTKILTAIIIIENHQLDEIVVMDDDSAHAGGSSLYVKEGESFTIEQLLYALMVRSANDVAEALAKYHSGTIEAFSEEMNAKAIELGAMNSNFVNPHGLHNPEHVTTAYDLAVIAKYCMKNDLFRQLVATIRYQIEPTPYQEEIRYLKNKNAFLHGIGSNYQMLYRGKNIDTKYDIVDGIKTGYTPEAGNCLVTSATIKNQKYISVILKSPGSYLFVDSRTLIDYGFENFIRHQFVSEGTFIQTHQIDDSKKSTINLIAGKSLTMTLPKNIDVSKIEREVLLNQGISAPINEGETLGRISYLYNNIEIASVHLVSEYNVDGGDLVTSIEGTFIKRTEDNKLDLRYYFGVFLKVLLSFVIYRTIITSIDIFRRKRIAKNRA